ncbi:MAG: AsmA family protein [Polaromonas sp.]
MTVSPPFLSSTAKRWLLATAGLLVVLVLLLTFFPWDLLRAPINRYVSGELGRRFEITRQLDVSLGRTTTVRLDGVELANPEWAGEPYLLKARSAEFDIKLWPLLLGKLNLPRVALSEPEIGLQIEPDGRRTWALSRDTSDTSAVPDIGTLLVDKGTLKYKAVGQGADVTAQFAVAAEGAGPDAALPLSYRASGRWKGEAFTADGRTGGVLQLSKNIEGVFPLEVNAVAGKTRLNAKGTITNLSELGALNASFDIQGQNLALLYRLTGVVLPSTPPYKLKGQLTHRGTVWAAEKIQGVLGSSDLSGNLSFDTAGAIPMLSGKVQSKVLDFTDLGAVVGVQPRAAAAGKAAVAVSEDGPAPAPSPAPRTGKVLPTAVLDFEKLNAMNADVTYSAADIRHVEALPLDKGSVHIKLNAGVLDLTPISIGLAGGTVAGSIRIDASVKPAVLATQLDVRAIQFNKLFPTVDLTKNSLGKFSGQLDLKGRGNSAAQMLGSASGNVALLMGKGEISNILMEFLGLDGGEVIKFFLRGDRNVRLQCAAAAFDVKDGLMTSRTIVLDTSDTVINGQGKVNLADETLDLLLSPQPKDVSILSFRSPLRIGGTFASPSAGPDKLALGGRAGLALALGVINPLLALAATIETGPGQDADCAKALNTAAQGKATVIKSTR